MRFNFNKIMIIVVSLLLIMGISVVVIMDTKANKVSEEVSLEAETILKIQQLDIEETKMQEFIISRLPDQNVFFDVSVSHENSDSNPKIIPIELLYAGLKTNNEDLLMSAFTLEALTNSWENKANYEEKLKIIHSYMDILTQGNSLANLTYQFQLDRYDIEKNEGVLNLEYQNNKIISIPFQIESSNDDEIGGEEVYHISTPLINMIKIIEDEI